MFPTSSCSFISPYFFIYFLPHDWLPHPSTSCWQLPTFLLPSLHPEVLPIPLPSYWSSNLLLHQSLQYIFTWCTNIPQQGRDTLDLGCQHPEIQVRSKTRRLNVASRNDCSGKRPEAGGSAALGDLGDKSDEAGSPRVTRRKLLRVRAQVKDRVPCQRAFV